MELLLKLIRDKDLQINEVSISMITNDFLSYVENYKQCDHQSIAEFIAVASTLLYIKTLSVLPSSQELDLDDDYEDPRKALIYQLIEYQKACQVVEFLQGKKSSQILVKKENSQLQEIKTKINYTEMTFKELLDCYLHYFAPVKTKFIIDKIKDTLSTVEEKITWWIKLLKKKATLSFFQVTAEFSVKEIIISFLATLEMAKQRKVQLSQEELFGDILVESKNGLVDGEQEEIA
jgi:segregation and condensation protein A